MTKQIGRVKPISPGDIAEQKKRNLPDEVIETWNRMIAKTFSSGYACIKQEDVVKELSKTLKVPEGHIFKEGWLEIEDLYRQAGWTVEYDKPGFNETYPATFKFSKRRHR